MTLKMTVGIVCRKREKWWKYRKKGRERIMKRVMRVRTKLNEEMDKRKRIEDECERIQGKETNRKENRSKA